MITGRNPKHFNNQAFLHDLYQSSIKIRDTDLALNYFINVFSLIVNNHAPFKKIRVKARSSPWFTADLADLLNSRNRAWTEDGCTKNPSCWLLVRQLRNCFTTALRKAKSAHLFANNFSNLNHNIESRPKSQGTISSSCSIPAWDVADTLLTFDARRSVGADNLDACFRNLSVLLIAECILYLFYLSILE